ncbi:MAG: NADH-quinone oxidoreductase subunit L, partial [Aquificaceae bacterium]
LFREQFFTERFYHRVMAWGYVKVSKTLYHVNERKVIDGLVNATYYIANLVGSSIKPLQDGRVNHYAFAMYIGLGLILFLILTLGR